MVKERRIALAALTAGTALALSWTPALAIAAEVDGPVAAVERVGSTANLPKTNEFHKVTRGIESGQTYALVSSDAPAGQEQRILHLTAGNPKLDRCQVGSAADKLTPVDCTIGGHAGKHEHEWTVSAVEGGYTIKSNAEDVYLNLTKGGGEARTTPQVLSIAPGEHGGYVVSAQVEGATRYLMHNDHGWTSADQPYEVLFYQSVEVLPEVVPNRKLTTGTTQDRPFAPNTGGSKNFRIPSLITHKDGSLLAAIDARWNHVGDAAGLDTIFSRSTDGGKTWSFNFPNYFPDSVDAFSNEATAFIDPVMAQKGDTTYMMVDLWPGGVALNTAKHQDPVNGSGYVQIDGRQRLVLFASPVPSEQRKVGAEQGEGYTHYVGDFAADGFAPVYRKDGGAVERYVDRHYYLYDQNKDPLYCQQLGSSAFVQQNVFFYKAELHVMATSYLWLISSNDAGATWSDPLMLNEQVRTNLPGGNAAFYGVGPGRGLVTSGGRIVLPCYTFIRGKGDGNASVIYSDDGVTWKRSTSLQHQTSESTVVEVDGVLYLFARHGWYAVSHDGGATWEEERSLRDFGINVYTGCQISALKYSKLIDGKPAILLSCPTGGSRANGKVYVGLVGEDGGIEWKYSHEVPGAKGRFAYSCLTERTDGSIDLLWEGEGDASNFAHFDMAQIAPGAEVSNKRAVSVPLYGSVKMKVAASFSGFGGVDGSIAKIKLDKNDDGTATLTIEGLKEGEVTFTDAASGIEYVVTVAPSALEEVKVEQGKEVFIPVSAGAIERKPDVSVARVEMTQAPFVEVWGEPAAALGSDPSFAEGVARLSSALYTFEKTDDAWAISGKTAAGERVYLNLSGGKMLSPNKAQSHPIELKSNDDGTFKLYDRGQLDDKVSGAHLHFWRDGKAKFDRCRNSCGAGDAFELWKRAGEARDASEIPGYERVASASELEDGESYLIVAKVGDARYVLNPAREGAGEYAHVAKVDPDRVQYRLKVTAVGPGTTDVLVGGTVHRITVPGDPTPEFPEGPGQGNEQGNGQLDPEDQEQDAGQGQGQGQGSGQGHDGGQHGGPHSASAKPGSGLPQTGDPAVMAAGVSALGALIGGLGFRFRKRK